MNQFYGALSWNTYTFRMLNIILDALIGIFFHSSIEFVVIMAYKTPALDKF